MNAHAIDNRSMEREIKAATILREQIIAAAGDDQDFIRDSLEGETSIFEMIDALVARDGEDGALIEGISNYIETVSNRLDRIKKRVEIRKALIGTALDLAEVKTRETPSGTVTRKATPATVIVTEESEIPSKFWRPQTPKLDKRALLQALNADEIIPGATLSNGGVTTQIKR